MVWANVLWNPTLQLSLSIWLFHFLFHIQSFFPHLLQISQCLPFPSSPLFHSWSFLFSSPSHFFFFPSRLPLSSLCSTSTARTQQVLILLETGPEAVCVWLLSRFVLFTSSEIITVYTHPSANERLRVPQSLTVCIISKWYLSPLSLSLLLSILASCTPLLLVQGKIRHVGLIPVGFCSCALGGHLFAVSPTLQLISFGICMFPWIILWLVLQLGLFWLNYMQIYRLFVGSGIWFGLICKR